MKIEIYSIQGKIIEGVILKQNTKDLQIQMPENVRNGIYFLRLKQDDLLKTEQFILSR